jgi:hypothetical protein
MVKEKVSLKDVEEEILRIVKKVFCAYCSSEIEGEVEFAIHRDGFGEGPEVPLCVECGSHPTPTCEEIWSKISRS